MISVKADDQGMKPQTGDATLSLHIRKHISDALIFNRHYVTKTLPIAQVSWSPKHVTPQELWTSDGSFPMLVCVESGYFGEGNIDSVTSGQAMVVQGVHKQRRVIALPKNMQHRHFSVPMLAFKHKFVLLSQKQPQITSTAAYLNEILKGKQLPLLVRFAEESLNSLYGHLQLVKVYDELYLYGHNMSADGGICLPMAAVPLYLDITLSVGVGVVGGNNSDWTIYKEAYVAESRRFLKDIVIAGYLEIAVFHSKWQQRESIQSDWNNSKVEAKSDLKKNKKSSNDSSDDSDEDDRYSYIQPSDYVKPHCDLADGDRVSIDFEEKVISVEGCSGLIWQELKAATIGTVSTAFDQQNDAYHSSLPSPPCLLPRSRQCGSNHATTFQKAGADQLVPSANPVTCAKAANQPAHPDLVRRFNSMPGISGVPSKPGNESSKTPTSHGHKRPPPLPPKSPFSKSHSEEAMPSRSLVADTKNALGSSCTPQSASPYYSSQNNPQHLPDRNEMKYRNSYERGAETLASPKTAPVHTVSPTQDGLKTSQQQVGQLSESAPSDSLLLQASFCKPLASDDFDSTLEQAGGDCAQPAHVDKNQQLSPSQRSHFHPYSAQYVKHQEPEKSMTLKTFDTVTISVAAERCNQLDYSRSVAKRSLPTTSLQMPTGEPARHESSELIQPSIPSSCQLRCAIKGSCSMPMSSTQIFEDDLSDSDDSYEVIDEGLVTCRGLKDNASRSVNTTPEGYEPVGIVEEIAQLHALRAQQHQGEKPFGSLTLRSTNSSTSINYPQPQAPHAGHQQHFQEPEVAAAVTHLKHVSSANFSNTSQQELHAAASETGSSVEIPNVAAALSKEGSLKPIIIKHSAHVAASTGLSATASCQSPRTMAPLIFPPSSSASPAEPLSTPLVPSQLALVSGDVRSTELSIPVTSQSNQRATADDKMFTCLADLPKGTVSLLTNAQLCQCLQVLGMHRCAEAFHADSMIDGVLLMDLQAADLCGHFGFTEYEAKKIIMFAKGWRPR